MHITFDFATKDDCLDKMVPSDLRQLVGDKERAEEQCKALAAQVEALKASLHRAITAFRQYELDVDDYPSMQHKQMIQALIETIEEPPAACLAQVRAEAGRAGFITGVEWWAKCELEDSLHLDEQSAADKYAERILKGEVT